MTLADSEMHAPDQSSTAMPAIERLDDEGMGELALLAAQTCAASMALLVIRDGGNLRVAGHHGVVKEEALALAKQASWPASFTLVTDTAVDPEWRQLILTRVGQPIRFVAMVPLLDAARQLQAAIYVFDQQPLQLDQRQQQSLMALAHLGALLAGRPTVGTKVGSDGGMTFLETDIAIVAAGNDGIISTFSQGAEKLLGVDADALIGHVPLQTLFDRTEQLPQADAQSADRGASASTLSHFALSHDNDVEANRNVWRYRHGGGVARKMQLAWAVLAEGEAGVSNCIGLMQAIPLLEASPDFLQTLIDSLPVMIYTKSMRRADRGAFVLWNQAAEAITGFPASYVVGQPGHHIFPPELAQLLEDLDDQVCLSRKPVELAEHMIRRPDGSQRSMRTRALPLFDTEGRVDYVLGISEDISANLRQQRELRKRQAEMEAASDASPLGIFESDQRGHLIYVNRTWTGIAGMAVNRAVGAGWLQAVHPDDRATVMAEWSRAVTARDGSKLEYRFLHADGNSVWVHAVAAPVIVDGVFTGLVGTVDDITIRRMAKEALGASEKRLRLITDNLPALVGYIDATQCYQFCNNSYRTLLGLDPSAMIGEHVSKVYGTTAYGTMQSQIEAALRGERVSFERTMGAPGATRCLQSEYIPDLSDNGAVVGFYAMVTDITARKAIEQKLADSESSLRTIADNLPVLISYIDREHILRFTNATLKAWTGISHHEAQGKPFVEVVGPRLYEQRRANLDRALSGERVEFETRSEALGIVRELHTVYLPDFVSDGSVQGLYALTTDITAVKATERQLTLLARSDTLTRLPNRYQLDESLQQALNRSRRNVDLLALLFLDIDHFKKINDTYGHGIGDAVLQEFSGRLQRSVRSTDTVARLGGDEFVIILEGLKSADEARLVATKILDLMAQQWHIGGHDFSVNTSIGIALANAAESSASALLEMADRSLYRAKAAGRNTFRVDNE